MPIHLGSDDVSISFYLGYFGETPEAANNIQVTLVARASNERRVQLHDRRFARPRINMIRGAPRSLTRTPLRFDIRCSAGKMQGKLA